MNYPIAVAFAFICFAVLAHMTGGIKESLSVRPARLADGSMGSVSQQKVERNWVQMMCAFQLVSVDLIAIAGVLYLLAFTDHLQPSRFIAIAMAVVFAFWGIAWLLQLMSLKRPRQDYFILGHWVFWFACSGLLVWGARTL